MKFDNPESASKAVLIEAMQVLGAFRDQLVIVGGSVPELLYPDRGHIGTLDVDLAVSPSALSGNAYKTIRKRLLDANFSHKNGPTRFEKNVEGLEEPVKLDLISGQYQTGEKLTSVQVNELNINTLRGLDLAFEICRPIEISGYMPDGTRNTVRARIVEPEAYILIKAFTLDERQKKKDAYDIVFILRNYEPNVESLAKRLRPLLTNGLAREGYDILRSKFQSIDSIGPTWAAEVYIEAGDDFEQSRRAAYEYAQALFSAANES
jgi:hypothetical protein